MKIKSLIARGLLCPLFAFAVLTASAAPIPIQLQPRSNPAQYGSIDPSYAWLELDKSQTFTAIPKAGCRFDRWTYQTSDPTAVQVDGSKITITNTQAFDPTLANTFMANFVLGSYKITFDPGDGGATSSLSVTNETEQKEHGGYPAFPNPTRDGYKFTGWTTNGVAWTVKQGDRIWLTEDVTALANWQAKPYRVTYMVNDGSGKSSYKDVLFGNNYELPNPDPTWTGHTFLGWYTEDTGGTKIDSYTRMNRAEPHNLYAHWTAAKYKVTFSPGEGGTVTPTFLSDVEFDSTYGKLPTPERDGFVFVGWYTASSGGSPVTAETKVSTAGDHTLYARWKGASYQIAKNVSNGCTLTVAANGVFGNALNFSWTAGQKTGYTATNTIVVVSATEGGAELAKYTNATASGQASYTMTGKYYSSITISVSSRFKPNSYRVSFDSQGGSTVNPKDVTYDAAYGELSVPTLTGYDFVGWFTAAEGGVEIKADTKVAITGQQTLYAHWTAAKYKVTFSPGEGGTVTPAFLSDVEFDSTYGKLPTPKRDGFVFVGWYTASSGGLPVTAETKVSTAGDHTLYAHWEGASYQVSTKMLDGCTLTVAANGVFGNALSLSWTAGQKTGYTATNTIVVVSATEGGAELAKYTNATASGQASYTMTGKYYSSITISVSSRFKPNSYRVSFDSQGGSTVNPKDVTYDAAYGELSVPTLTGYDFVGWFTAAEGGVEIKADTKVAITGQQTLYAHWTAKNYTVKTEVVGSVVLNVAATGTFDQSLVIAWTVEEKTGYAVKLEKVEIFANESGSGKLLGTYTSGGGTEYKMEGAYYSGIVIKAMTSQTPNSYTVKFDANGARGKMDSITCTYDKSFDLPKQNSYTSLTAKFLGWSRDPKATVPDWADEAKGIKNLTDVDDGEVTLYAVWQDLQNELTRAAHGKNVILETTGEVPFHAYTNAVGQTFAQSGNWSYPPCTMSVTVSGPGTFSFVWKREPSESGNFLLSIETENPSNISDARWGGVDDGDGWTRVTRNFTGTGNRQVTWYSVADDYQQDYLLIDQVEWQPAGWVDEPTEADRRDISVVTMANGELAISFENADSRFAYSLHGTNDLTAARSLWPVLFTTNDTGKITIKPEVKTDEKQFFYYLEVHSK